MPSYYKVLLFFFLIFQINSEAQTQSERKQEIKKLLSESGKAFQNLENEQSIKFAHKALNIASSYNEKIYAARACNLLGLNFAEFSDLNKAISYYEKGLSFIKNEKNDTLKGWLHNNLANIYCYNEVDFKKGIKHYKLGIQYSEKFNDASEIVFSKLNLVSALFSIQNYSEGIAYLNDVKAFVDKNGDLEANITMNLLFANYYDAVNNFQKAEEYYLKTIEFCEKNTDIPYLNTHILNAYRFISVFYHNQKNYEKAYYFLSKQDILKDEIYNVERSQAISDIAAAIDKEESVKQFEKIKAEQQIQEQRLKSTRIIVILFVIIFIALSLLTLTFYRNNKERKRTNEELKLTNAKLQNAKEKAEEVSNLKSQFISTISHELRTPLYGVIGTTEIIEEEYKELKDTSHLNALKFSANYLLALVNDILKVYKIEENKLQLESEIFSLEDKLTKIKDSLQTIANKNNNKIIIEVDSKIPKYLNSDAVRLSQIIINLMSNSLKFTKNGYVKIAAIPTKIVGEVHYIQLIVSDNGIGIPKKYQEKVFDKFVQLERKEDDYQGTGLGLTIVKKLVNLFKGTIFLESEEGKGTQFTIEIPFLAEETHIVENTTKSSDSFFEQNTENYRVLVVEDNKINQTVTKRLLEKFNFSCDMVDDGFIALERLEQKQYNAILMDINMPKINGFDTSKLIRDKGIAIPIIAVTAFEKDEILEKVKEAQINDVVVKPFDPKELNILLRKHIQKN